MKSLRAILVGLAALAGAVASPAAAQQTVMVEHAIGTPDDYVALINRYNVRRAGHLADALAAVTYAQPWKLYGLESNQKWIRFRMDCNTGAFHRAVTEDSNGPVNIGNAEGERILLATPLSTASETTPLRQAMCRPVEQKIDVPHPWPAYDIVLGGGTDQLPLVNPDVQKFPWGGGALMEAFARTRFARANDEAMKGITTWSAFKPVPGLPTSGFLPVAMPLTFYTNLYKTVVERGYVDFGSVFQRSDTLYAYNVYVSGRNNHSKTGKAQPVQIIGVLVQCGTRPRQMLTNMTSVTPDPEKYETMPLPRAAMQWSDTLSEFSRALCSKQRSFAARPLATYQEARKALWDALTPLPIGS